MRTPTLIFLSVEGEKGSNFRFLLADIVSNQIFERLISLAVSIPLKNKKLCGHPANSAIKSPVSADAALGEVWTPA